MSIEEQRRQVFEAWESMAPGWERWADEIEQTALPVQEWLVRALAPKAGDTVLELAAGPGSTGFATAPLVGEGGRILSTDFSPAMVEVARRRGERLGLTNVEHRVMDGHDLELEDDSVDGVLCRFGLMLMPDPAAALAETRRVLRPGGRLALAVWRGPEQNPWISIAGRMLVERGFMAPPEPGAPGVFSLASDERLRELLEGAEFAVERMEDVQARFVYPDAEGYIVRAVDTGGPFAQAWREAPDEARSEMEAQLITAFAPFEVDGRYEFPGVALCVLAS